MAATKRPSFGRRAKKLATHLEPAMLRSDSAPSVAQPLTPLPTPLFRVIDRGNRKFSGKRAKDLGNEVKFQRSSVYQSSCTLQLDWTGSCSL
jgi:hypothetical protein